MSLSAVIFGPRSKEYIREFLDLPSRIYARQELMQDAEEERKLLEGRHVLSHYFTVTPILIYEDRRAVSRGILTVYPDEDRAFLGFFESENNAAAAGLLFHTALGLARDRGLKAVIGPVDCSFWLKYRLKTNRFNNPYTGEPYNKDYYLRLWEENGFQVSEQYASSHYVAIKGDESGVKYMGGLEEKGYMIKSPKAGEFYRMMKDIYRLQAELYGDAPAYMSITWREFRRLIRQLRFLLNYSAVKMAYHEGKAVGYFVCVPNFGNAVYGKRRLWKLPGLLARRRKPESYVMLSVGVDAGHQELARALAEAVHTELKRQQASSSGPLIRRGSGDEEHTGWLADYAYEYVLLERRI